MIGWTPQQIAGDVDTDIAFSPDTTRIAFARGGDPVVGQWRILSANLDGSDERVLHIEPDAAFPPQSLSWSPDGKLIAYSLFVSEQIVQRHRFVGSRKLQDFGARRFQIQIRQ